MNQTLRIHTDGGARPTNPGPAASSFFFPDEGFGYGWFIGESRTNNEAEAEAMLRALHYALDHGYQTVDVFSDSKLIVNQALGMWQVKAPTMLPYIDQIQLAIHKLGSQNLQITHVRREFNKEADLICNEVLDRYEGGECLTYPTRFEIPLLP